MYNKDYILEQLSFIQNKINKKKVDIIAVTKTHPFDLLALCSSIGISKLGENRIQEALPKWDQCKEKNISITPHLIGNLQSNKIKYLNDTIYSYDALSSVEQVHKIKNHYEKKQYKPLKVLIQINSSMEEQKSGIPIHDVDTIHKVIEACILSQKYISLEGFMTIGPTPTLKDTMDIKQIQICFERTRKIKEEMEANFGLQWQRLSMGMSHDFEIAIQEGATEIRIGSLLFGTR